MSTKLKVLEAAIFLSSMGLAELTPFMMAAMFGVTWPVMAGGLFAFMMGMFAARFRVPP